MDIKDLLEIGQIIISILLVTTILLQQRGAGSSAITGGSQASYYTKRGFEKVLFIATIVLAVFFLATAFASLLI